ncbi:hypothetical protein CDD83_7132 [Cordyceps sp. RAO-2017]|nr:hypothetical protein CDD83_7132 [Cordyceps sp. RAO-2017]
MIFYSTAAALALAGSVLAKAYGSPGPVGDGSSSSSCKCFPGDDCWPGPAEWARLNETVHGRLVATVPLGSPCHDPNYDEGACLALRRRWSYPSIHTASSSSVMAPLFSNLSCDPFQPRDSPCLLGNYVRYAVEARCAEDIIDTLRFADEHNVRFVIRNTGHDFQGRSTGAGALSVWTHRLKDMELLDWADKRYTGKALKVGAGVVTFEALEFAQKAGLVVITGQCFSVGLAGGYIQGGGHSALSSRYGLAADNALSYEVVTPSGRLVTASPSEHPDLYWALSGGGGGNFGVVVSATVKAHPDARVAGASWDVGLPEGNEDALLEAVDAFHASLPKLIESGIMVVYSFGRKFVKGISMTAYNMTKAEAQQALQPFSEAVGSLGLRLTANFTEFRNYYEHLSHYFGPAPDGNIMVGVALYGGRLIPRQALARFAPTARRLVGLDATFIGVGLDVSRFGSRMANAVLPQWREATVHAAVSRPWTPGAPLEQMQAEQDRITRVIQPVLEAATPGSGAYMNEADFQQPDFQDVFFGANYPRLLRIKRKYDGRGLLYATAGVGSEDWDVHRDGRMCRRRSRSGKEDDTYGPGERHDARPRGSDWVPSTSR